MKIKMLILLSVLLLQISNVLAADKFSICLAGGYYSGVENKFLSGLAHYMANKQNVLIDPECTSNWKAGERVARKYTETGKLSNEFERTVVKRATEFSDQVYSKLSEGIKFDE